MHPKWIRLFVVSAGILLLVTAVAKIVSAMGSARIIDTSDPLFNLPYRTVFWLVGAVELVIAGTCFFSKQLALPAGLIAWLATSFVFYRVGLLWMGYVGPCSCLGNLTDALHVSPQKADLAMKVVLGYLLIGSYAAVFWLRKNGKAQNPTAPAPADQTLASV